MLRRSRSRGSYRTTQGRAQASVPLAEQGSGTAQTAGAPQIPAGQVVEGEDEEEDVNEEINADPPPSPRDRDENNHRQGAQLYQEPTVAEAMATQTQILQQLVQIAAQNEKTPKEGLQRRIDSIIKLKAPTFDHSDDPLEAEDWLRVIEKKLDLTAYIDEECVALAAHQLDGTARDWWDNYCYAHKNPTRISWKDFTEAFREYHIPRQLIINKVEEFRNMTQGTMKVHEYARHFTRMMRYVPVETDTEEKKMFWFHRGLNYEIRIILVGDDYSSFMSMVN